MAAVGAARWDVVWDRGADWSARLGRRTRNDAVLRLDGPAAWEVRAVDAPSTAPLLLTVAVEVAADGDLDVFVERAQIEALATDRAEYRVLARDALSGNELVLLRGYVKIRDRVGDD